MYLWVGALLDFCPESKEQQHFPMTEPHFAERWQQKHNQVIWVPCKQEKTRVLLVSATLCSCDGTSESSRELPRLGKASAVARRAVSKARCASPWQSSCMKEMWNLIQAFWIRFFLTGNVWSMTDQGPWRITLWDRLWLSHTTVQEQSQDWTQYATQMWCDPALLPGGKSWEHLAFSSRPDWISRQGWLLCSLANPWWTFFASATSSPSILVFTLCDLCQQTKQTGPFPEVPLFSVKNRWHL